MRRRTCRRTLGTFWVTAALAAVLAGRPAPAGPGASPAPDPTVELGRRLFFDPAISRSGNNSCVSCHDPAHGFADARPVSDDDFLPTRRHAQTLIDSGDAPAIHWDGEFASLEDLVVARLGTPSGRRRNSYAAEPSITFVDDFGETQTVFPSQLPPFRDGIEADGRYADGFRRAFGSPQVTEARLAAAIAGYVRTIRSTESAWDRFAAGDAGAIPPEAKRGFELFRGRAGCAECHLVQEKGRATFTDQQFHNTGVAWRTARSKAPGFPGAEIPREAIVASVADHGRATPSTNPADEGRFKTPTLRDVSSRPPYMHDGSFATLEEVVGYYAEGGTPNAHLDGEVRAFDAAPEDVAAVVAFLKALTCEVRPALAPDLPSRAKRTRVRLTDASGKALRGIRVGLVPEGDPLPGDTPATSPSVEAVTDGDGWFDFVPGRRTHTRLVLPNGLRAPGGDWIPDVCARLELRLPVRGRVAAVVEFPPGVSPPKRLAARADPATSAALAPPPRRTVFALEHVAEVGGKAVARYAAWVREDAPKTAVLDVPVGEKRFSPPVPLEPGAEHRIDLSSE